MDHNAMKDMLFALYDGELNGEARRMAETHLAACEECRRQYAQWQQTARTFFKTPDVQTSEAFVHQVMGRLESSVRPRRAAPWMWVRWAVPALGLVGLLMLVRVPASRAVSLEALLLADGPESAPTQLVLASDTPSADDMLGFVMEGQP